MREPERFEVHLPWRSNDNPSKVIHNGEDITHRINHVEVSSGVNGATQVTVTYAYCEVN